MFVRKFITILNIVLNDFFECLRFSCLYNKGSEIISVVVYILKIYIYFVVSDAICRLSTFILDSRLFYFWLSTFLLSTLDFFTLDSRLFSLDSRLLLSTLDFYSRLSTFTLDPRLLDTLNIDGDVAILTAMLQYWREQNTCFDCKTTIEGHSFKLDMKKEK